MTVTWVTARIFTEVFEVAKSANGTTRSHGQRFSSRLVRTMSAVRFIAASRVAFLFGCQLFLFDLLECLLINLSRRIGLESRHFVDAQKVDASVWEESHSGEAIHCLWDLLGEKQSSVLHLPMQQMEVPLKFRACAGRFHAFHKLNE